MANLLVQLVEQGIQKGFVQNVIRTLDKECYLDRHYVQKSIVFLTEKDRKITIEALAEELCIEQSVIKDMVNELSANQNWTVVDDLILTLHVLEYMNNVALDFNKAVESKGYVFTVAQSQALRLPYSLLKTIMVSLMENDNYVSYTQLPDMIATKAYIDKCKSDIQSSLASLEEPFPVFKIQKSLSMPEELFYLLLEQLVKEEGILRGKKSRAVFEPKHYKQRQLTLIKSIFDSNGCINVDTVESLYSFSSPVDIISSNYDKDSFICLNSCIIKTSVKDKAREVVESVTEYCDVNDILPAGLTFEDVEKVIEIIIDDIHASNISNIKLVVLNGGYVITAEYMQHLVTKSDHYLKSLSRTLRQHHQNKSHGHSVNLSDKEIIRAFEHVGCSHLIAEKILPFTRSSMLKRFTELLKTPYMEAETVASGDQWIIKHKELTLKKLNHLGRSIYFNHQAALLFKDVSAKKSLEKYVLKNQCIEFLFHVVIYLILDQSYNKAEVSQSSSLCISLEDIENQRIVDSKEQKCVITYFIRENDHKYDKTSVIEMEDLVKKKDLQKFIINILVKDKQGWFKEKDALCSAKTKKLANEIIHNQLKQQLQQLSLSISTVPELLHLVSLLIFQKVFEVPLYVSGKFVPVILEQIKPSLSKQEQDLLDIAHLSIVENKREEHMDDYRKLKELGNKL